MGEAGAGQGEGAARDQQRVVARATVLQKVRVKYQYIRAGAATQGVGAGAAIERIRTGVAVEGVDAAVSNT